MPSYSRLRWRFIVPGVWAMLTALAPGGEDLVLAVAMSLAFLLLGGLLVYAGCRRRKPRAGLPIPALEARSRNCLSATYVLLRKGRPHGLFRSRWFGERLEIATLGRRRLQLDSGLDGGLRLVDVRTAAVLGDATPQWSGVDLNLSGGPARLVPAGFFSRTYRLERGDDTIAWVDWIDCCERGWVILDGADLTPSDLLLVGVVYQTILRRRRSA